MLKKVSLTVLLISSTLLAQNKEHHNESMGVKTLSSELRVLLSQEMVALEKAMKTILSSMIAGDYTSIEETAVKIKNSFILKQKLTSTQKEELHTKLPQSFIAQDKEFHNDAKMLQHVASNKNPELTSFYFNKMLNACVSCHQTFAQEKFPLFKLIENQNHHNH
jgi:cytochrome c556